MRADELLPWVRATPFVPFRIRMNSGRTFDIRHPEMVRVGRSTVHIFTVGNTPSEEPYEQFEMISLLLIEGVSPLQATAQA